MRRGQKKLHLSLINNTTDQSPDNKHQRNVYITHRDDALACRYYFYAIIRKMHYEACLEQLALEFYLTQNSIIARLEKRYDYIKLLKTQQAKPNALRKLFPWYVWN